MTLQDYQLITFQYDLTDEINPMIGEFTLHFMLRVPRSHIATEIRTGFPSLIQSDRALIEWTVDQQFEDYLQLHSNESMRPLDFINRFVEYLEPELLLLFRNELSDLYLESISVSVFTDILNRSKNQTYQ